MSNQESNSTITPKQWVKFVKGYAKANETRTDRQVFHGDVERQKNWRSN